MHFRLLLSTFLLVSLLRAAPAQEMEVDHEHDSDNVEFPYEAYINADDVYVRSGPGQNYYPVLRLRRGDVVDVYRHDPGGWYAIRPPIQCFSWVSAEFVEPGEGRTATIKGDHVVARVGSAFSDIRDVIQIRLNDGEPIEVFEARRIGSGPAAQTWYKIAPPAGEFRWISGKFIDRERPRHEARRANPNNNLLIAQQQRRLASARQSQDELDDSDRRQGSHQYEDDDAPRASFVSRRPPADRDYDPDIDQDSWRSRRSRRAGKDEYPAIDASRSASRPRSSSAHGDKDLLKELDDLDLALSTEVAKDPRTWNLRPLRSQTEALLLRSDSALDRGRVRLVQRKVARFEEIQQRQANLDSNQLASDLRNRDVIQASLGSALGMRTDIPPPFDGTGRLTQVYPAQAGVAGFALVDREGRITQYVTAAPGVNLRPLLGQEVGVQGTLGFMPDARTPHVTARHVAVITPGGPLMR